MTHSVVSAGDTRLFAGMGLGVGKARIFVIVVFIGALRLTMPASASVAVFTDQPSTPHCARRLEGRTSRMPTTRKTRRRKLSMVTSPDRYLVCRLGEVTGSFTGSA